MQALNYSVKRVDLKIVPLFARKEFKRSGGIIPLVLNLSDG